MYYHRQFFTIHDAGSNQRCHSAERSARPIRMCGAIRPAERTSVRHGYTQFINHVIDDLLKVMHTNKRDILAGEHTQNSIVERRNKEVNRHLRNILVWYKSSREVEWGMPFHPKKSKFTEDGTYWYLSRSDNLRELSESGFRYHLTKDTWPG